MAVRVRFCPSPTGFLHVGGVRTALYNWLYARHHGGTAILRIEDTDTAREAAGATEQIARSLDWLGLDWDESPARGGPHAPYLQSERLALYHEAVDRLLADGRAYRDYRTPEEVDAAREAARTTDDPASATRVQRELTREQVAEFEAAGRRPTVRFRLPEEGVTEIVDLVRGEIRFEHRLLGDTVLLKADGGPTYQLANPFDDWVTGVTHVIRGEDLLSSTPRQKLLVEALGGSFPVTAHLPMILGPDRKRFSKRHGAVSVEEFRASGYVPEAVVNYLALLGWSYDETTEIMSVAELVERFTLERVHPSPAVFDHQKLLWMNGVHLRGLSLDAYERRLREALAEAHSPLAERPGLAAAVPLVQEKIATLGEFESFAGFLFTPAVYEEAAWEKLVATPRAAEILDGAVTRLEGLDGFAVEDVEAALRSLLDDLGLKPRTAFTPIRVAVAGRTIAPGLFESVSLLGREETLGRLRAARARLAA